MGYPVRVKQTPESPVRVSGSKQATRSYCGRGEGKGERLRGVAATDHEKTQLPPLSLEQTVSFTLDTELVPYLSSRRSRGEGPRTDTGARSD